MAWFARLGAPLDDRESSLARRYAQALGLDSVTVAAGWKEVERLARDPASGESWWAREEAERAA